MQGYPIHLRRLCESTQVYYDHLLECIAEMHVLVPGIADLSIHSLIRLFTNDPELARQVFRLANTVVEEQKELRGVLDYFTEGVHCIGTLEDIDRLYHMIAKGNQYPWVTRVFMIASAYGGLPKEPLDFPTPDTIA